MSDTKGKTLMDVFTAEGTTDQPETDILGVKLGKHECMVLNETFASEGFDILRRMLEGVRRHAIDSTLGSYGQDDDQMYQRHKARYLLSQELLDMPEAISTMALQFIMDDKRATE